MTADNELYGPSAIAIAGAAVVPSSLAQGGFSLKSICSDHDPGPVTDQGGL